MFKLMSYKTEDSILKNMVGDLITGNCGSRFKVIILIGKYNFKNYLNDQNHSKQSRVLILILNP